MKVFLIRTERKSTHTLGVLVVGDQRFATIERGWHNNRRNVSCIPEGTYQVDYLATSSSGKYKKCWHVRQVKNRGGILIHNGNLARHSKGCIILGSRAGNLNGNRAVLASKPAMRKLYKLLGEEPFTLEII